MNHHLQTLAELPIPDHPHLPPWHRRTIDDARDDLRDAIAQDDPRGTVAAASRIVGAVTHALLNSSGYILGNRAEYTRIIDEALHPFTDHTDTADAPYAHVLKTAQELAHPTAQRTQPPLSLALSTSLSWAHWLLNEPRSLPLPPAVTKLESGEPFTQDDIEQATEEILTSAGSTGAHQRRFGIAIANYHARSPHTATHSVAALIPAHGTRDPWPPHLREGPVHGLLLTPDGTRDPWPPHFREGLVYGLLLTPDGTTDLTRDAVNLIETAFDLADKHPDRTAITERLAYAVTHSTTTGPRDQITAAHRRASYISHVVTAAHPKLHRHWDAIATHLAVTLIAP